MPPPLATRPPSLSLLGRSSQLVRLAFQLQHVSHVSYIGSDLYGCSHRYTCPAWPQGGRRPYHPECGRCGVRPIPCIAYQQEMNHESRKDALRSLIISQRLLGTREIALFHHTGCGMTTFSTSQLRELVRSSGATSAEIERIDFHEFADVDSAVKSDVEWLKKEPLILPETVITGWVYEVETGKVTNHPCNLRVDVDAICRCARSSKCTFDAVHVRYWCRELIVPSMLWHAQLRWPR
jgi:hypothetical protein